MTKADRTIERKTGPGLPSGAVVALIAGGGSLPDQIANRLAESGQKLVIFGIDGEVDGGIEFSSHQVENIRLEEFGGLIARLNKHGVTHLLMAGTVRRRPKLAAMRWSWGAVMAALDVAKSLMRGDDKLLKSVIDHIEKHGIRVISAQDILPELLTAEGLVAGPRPTKRAMADIAAAQAGAKAIGALDIGQAAIAIGGRVIALEGVEGTAGLLERTAALRNHGRLAGAKGGVLVKCAKPDQELRADLPAIGPDTIEAAVKAGLSGIALEAGRSLIIEREKTLKMASANGLFIFGIEVR